MSQSSTAAPSPAPALYRKLRPRPNGPPRKDIVANQRARLHGAMIEASAARGYPDTSVAELCRLAGVSKRTFYEQFENKEACFLRSYDMVVDCAEARIASARQPERGWEANLRAGLETLVRAVAKAPKVARLALLEPPNVGPAALLCREQMRLEFERLLVAGFPEEPSGHLPPLLAKGIVCGVERVLCQSLLTQRLLAPAGLASQLAEWALSYSSPALGDLPEEIPSLHDQRWAARSGRRARFASDRARILRATGEIVARDGYAQLTAAKIATRAQVSEETFRTFYAGTNQCFLDALDFLGLEALTLASETSRDAGDGLPGVCLGIRALMTHLAVDPVLRGVMFLEVSAAGELAIRRRERLLRSIADLFLKRIPNKPQPSRVQAEATIGALWGAIHDHVQRDSTDLLPASAAHIAYLALAPLVGAETAVEAIRVLQPVHS